MLGLSDSVWSAAGTFTPAGGGSLDLLHSNLSANPASIAETTLVTFTITAVRPEGLANPLNRVYAFSSSKPAAFTSAATMRIAFNDAGYGPEDVAPHLIQCYYFEPATNTWIVTGTLYDLQQKQFVVNVVPNSAYAFGRRSRS